MIQLDRSYRLLICDLDNTLYDWVSFFVASFYAMVDEAVEILACDREILLDDLRNVHRRWHDSEHPFALLETRTVLSRFPGKNRDELKAILDSAFHKFNSVRIRELKEYPGVGAGLRKIEESGALIVGHTESNAYAAKLRLERLNLIGFFSMVYCRETSGQSHPTSKNSSEKFDALVARQFHQLKRHRRKPDPHVLREILADFNVAPHEAAYVGDSITRDVKMAKDVGVTAVWAKYGTRHAIGAYEKLVRVTHWTDEDVVRERELSKATQAIKPDYIAENNFTEVASFVTGGVREFAT
ncbi:MAG: HAD hydrolase-like protein [Alphaproteobacteria bacterium]|nr:HAD hydrolase-like protein [Alphaproteobacteria bacterium]